MTTKPRSWWQKIRSGLRWLRKKIQKHRVAIGVIAIVLMVLIALILVGYQFDWTGLNGYNKVTLARTISGTNAGTVTRTEEYQPGKSLWDWLQLLIIPAGLALFAFWYSRKQQQATEQRAQIESDRALEFQRQTTLQTYIDRMSDLLLEKDVDTIKQDTKLLAAMRARTLTALVALDASRKTSVFEFLYSIGLIHVVYLGEADFSGASMNGANLREIKFRKVNLRGANLRSITLAKADLMNADLSGANLSRSDLFETELTGANLSGADLSDSILDRANLNDADLRGATYTDEQLSKVAYRERLKT